MKMVDLRLEATYYIRQMRCSVGSPAFDYWATKFDEVLEAMSALEKALFDTPAPSSVVALTWRERLRLWFSGHTIP